MNQDANNRQLHPDEARLIRDNAAAYARRRGISTDKAEAELAQQALRNIDGAHDVQLGPDDALAQDFLQDLGAGQRRRDRVTGQTFELFVADEATRSNHAQFGQYAKGDSTTQAVLDQAYSPAVKPPGGQTLQGVNGSFAGATTGSDLALQQAAGDLAHMRQQPPAVQWEVLASLRTQRLADKAEQLSLLEDMQALRARSAKGAKSVQDEARAEAIISRLSQLEFSDQDLRKSTVAQLQAMQSAGLTNPASHREWAEGSGDAIGASRLAFTGLTNASIASKISMLKTAVQETKAAVAIARSEAQAVAKARVENNATVESARDPFNVQSPENTAATNNLRNKAAADDASGTNNPHYDAKHGPGTTNEQQYQRAMNGVDPVTGNVTRQRPDASRFFNSADMDFAIKKAEAEYVANPGEYNSKDGILIEFSRPVGNGYIGNNPGNVSAGLTPGEHRWTKIITVKIDKNTGKAYTAFPDLQSGGYAVPDPRKAK